MEPESRTERRSLKFGNDHADIVVGTLGWSDAEGEEFRMSKHLTYVVVSLFIVVIVAAQTAIAASHRDCRNRRLQCHRRLLCTWPKDPSVDPGDPTLSGPPPHNNDDYDDTSYVPRCPDSIAGAETGSRSGDNYWAFDDQAVCNNQDWEGQSRSTASKTPGWTSVASTEWTGKISESLTSNWYLGIWMMWLMGVMVIGMLLRQPSPEQPQSIRRPASSAAVSAQIGCFPPGVKITMADGSLRNIEDVRAGDMVRNAKTGAPVKVGKVIEGPEALPLIRFGFDGTTVTTSQAHPVLTAAGLKPANQLKKGDTVFDAQGNPHPVTILETLPIEEGQRVINVDLEAASSDANERTDSL